MTDPFEHHPDSKKNLLRRKPKDPVNIRDIFKKRINNLNKETAPTWGYTKRHIKILLDELIKDIDKENIKL